MEKPRGPEKKPFSLRSGIENLVQFSFFSFKNYFLEPNNIFLN